MVAFGSWHCTCLCPEVTRLEICSTEFVAWVAGGSLGNRPSSGSVAHVHMLYSDKAGCCTVGHADFCCRWLLQTIQDGFQHEQPDYWLNFGNPWEIERLNIAYTIKFYGHVSVQDEGGKQTFKWNPGESVRVVCL